MEDTPTVLIVDDEHDLADLYSTWLREDYDVRTAYDGEGAFELLDEDVDIALIDRLMPEVSGDEVVEHVRTQGYDVRVAMVTAVEPDFDILELGFDEYIVKPVRHDELIETVERLRSRSSYDEQLREFFSLVSKRAALESQKAPSELADSEAYAELTEAIVQRRDELDAATSELDERDFEVELHRIGTESNA